MCFACAVTNKLAFAQGYFAQFSQQGAPTSAHFAAASAAPALVDNMSPAQIAFTADDFRAVEAAAAVDSPEVAEAADGALDAASVSTPPAALIEDADLFFRADDKPGYSSGIGRVDPADFADMDVAAARFADVRAAGMTGPTVNGAADVAFVAGDVTEADTGQQRLDPAALENTSFKSTIGRKSFDALEVDGVGDKLEPIAAQPLLVIDEEDVPDDTSTTVTIEVDGEHIVSQLHTIGDQDFFIVELVEGQLYQIGQYAYSGADGPSGVPLADAYIELYDSEGTLITEADGGGPNTPSGLDALLTYEADYTGTYYINARAYDETPLDGTNGDAVGDYELFVDDVTGLVEGPYYDPEDLLYSIDWGGVLVDGTARNPDGDEGTRDTGNEQGDPDDKGTDITGKNVIKIYFAKAGDVYTPEDPAEPGLPPVAVAVGATDFEYEAVWTSLHEFEKVADVVYVETQIREEADFHYVTYTGTPGPGVSLLGSMAPPQTSDEGLALFNSNDERWTEEGLAQGGFSFVTLIHEFGHGHGMAHPHDTGGGSDIMDGVEPEGPVASYTLGDYDLNQGVFTMMSYEDGWQSSPYGNAETDAGYGYLGGLMALDIAVIQDKYGVNEEWATGDDVYRLKDENAAGTFFYSIWDAGGTDLIRYDGVRNSNVDLRAASLQYEVGGGGFVSYAHGIYGGFTVANGVTIENALSGAGNDTVTGNSADNWLRSSGGNDLVKGNGGADVVSGGEGDDTLSGGTGADQLFGDAGNDQLFGNAQADFLSGGAGNDSLYGGGDDDTLSGGIGDDVLDGGTGNDKLRGDAGNDYARGGAGNDILQGGDGNDVLLGGGGMDALFGDAGNDILVGNSQSDTLNGGDGSDTLNGGGDDDVLDGGDDTDYLVGESGNDTLFGGNGKDQLRGDDGNDVLTGGAGKDLLLGGGGEDRLFGQGGNDILLGGSQSDTLNGGAGDDTLNGGGDEDVLAGGTGSDLFVFEDDFGDDTIIDFEGGLDSISLADFSEENGGDALTFDQLLVTQNGADTQIQLDLDRDGVADAIDFDGDGDTDSVSITLLNVSSADITAADFVF